MTGLRCVPGPVGIWMLGVLVSVSCVDAGQSRVSVPLTARGTEPAGAVMTVGDVPMTLARADLAFGPLYLCPGNTAGELCETARLEWLDAAVVDTLDPGDQVLGQLEGVSGEVRSWMYDLGLSSQLTVEAPVVLPAAESLGGVSFVLEGEVTFAGQTVPVRASVAVQQTDDTELGVPVVRKSGSDPFGHDVQSSNETLSVAFDPSPWVARVDLQPWLAPAACEAGGPLEVCDGATLSICAEDGAVVDTTDCGATGEVCVQGRGCVDALVLDESTAAYDALRLSLLAGERPVFSWGGTP